MRRGQQTRDGTPRTVPKMAYRIDEACLALGIGRTSIYYLHSEGKIKFIKIAGRTLVPASEIERLSSQGD